MGIRKAVPEDCLRLLKLADQKRAQYEGYSPVFWKNSKDGPEKQKGVFEKLITDENVISLVFEEDGEIQGFAFGTLTEPPGVYAPGGKACLIDDFMVSKPELWEKVGLALKEAVSEEAKSKGAVISVTVCGQMDVPKRKMLEADGNHVASQWYVKVL